MSNTGGQSSKKYIQINFVVSILCLIIVVPNQANHSFIHQPKVKAMNQEIEQVFENESEGRYPVLTHSNPINSPYVGSKLTFKHGCRYGYKYALLQQKETNNSLPDIELVASKVHDAWWKAKEENGFHAPRDCESENRRGYTQTARQNQERFDDHFNEKFYKWCDKCHPDMYPYNDLSETVKDYDRTTVKAVYQAIKELS